MKVLLDLTKLLKEGQITPAEFDKLKQLSAQTTGALAFNLFIGLGVIAVVCATLALVPTPYTAIVLGVLLSAIGLALLNWVTNWNLVAKMCIPIGALLLSGGILWLYQGSPTAWIIVTILLFAGAITARHSLLMILSILSLSSTLASSANYEHATYEIVIQQPSVTIVLFGLISFLAYWISQHFDDAYERLALMASRTSLFLVNFAFWVGSLWGDQLPRGIIIPDWVFAILWAISLLLAGMWAVKADRRWLLNVIAVFAAIHFYTQWFERLGASPATLLGAGLLALIFALCLKKMNAWFTADQ